MSRDMFRGLITGIILAVIIGYGVLYVRSLNVRIAGIENFLNNAIKQQQQQRPMPQPQEVKTK